MNPPLLSIVLPVHNQVDHVASVVESYLEALNKIPNPHEIILVPNGCSDDSLNVCGQIAELEPSVRVRNCEENGWGLAVKVGLEEALGDILCYTNLARTSAEDLLLMLLYTVAHPDVIVKANRKIRESWVRRLGSLLYNIECRAFFDLPYWDINGTPKVFPRTCSALLKLTRTDDLIDAEFNIICRREAYRVLEVPIFSYKRHSGGSTTNFSAALRMYWGAYKMWRSSPGKSE